MRKLFLAAAVKPQLGQMLFVMFSVFIITACTKTNTVDMESPDNSLPASQRKPLPPPPPGPANPAIVFNADTIFQHKGQARSVQAIFVMDADGSHRKMIYHDFITSGSSWSIGNASAPKWSSNGQQFCFSGRVHTSSIPPMRPTTSFNSIYTMNFTLENGVPTATNRIKILDGPTVGVDYSNPSWSAGTNEILVRANQSGSPNKLQVVSATGGAPATIYIAPDTDHMIVTPCFSPDGSRIAFHLRNNLTGEKWLKVIDRSSGAEVNSIVLDPAYSWTDLDWGRGTGNTMLCFRNSIPNTGGQGNLYTLDFSVSSTPVPVASNAISPTWSPDNSKIAFGESTTGLGIRILTVSTGSVFSISTSGASALNWKR